jgi:hypothetical protein
VVVSGGCLGFPGAQQAAPSLVQADVFVGGEKSDDDGVTWSKPIEITKGVKSQVVELADGRLMHNMRNHPPRPSENFRIVGISTNGGPTHVGPLVEDRGMIEPPAQASIIRYPTSGAGAAIGSCSPTGRVAAATDDGTRLTFATFPLDWLEQEGNSRGQHQP